MNRMNREKTISLRHFVFQYILPLFLGVLVLVLVSYFNELRSQETKNELQYLNNSLKERDERISVLEARVSALEARVLVLEETQNAATSTAKN